MKHIKNWLFPTLTIEQSARMAKHAYVDSVSEIPTNKPRDIYTWSNLCTDPYVFAVEGFEPSHTIFVVRGTAIWTDWTAHNLLAVVGTSNTSHFNTAYEKVSEYLTKNPEVRTVSFVGHSMGAHLSDLLAARIFKEGQENIRNIQVKYVRMFDSNGSRESIYNLYEQNDDLVQWYLKSVKRVDMCGAPNIVNLAGEHLSQVQYLKKYGDFDIDLVDATNNIDSLLNNSEHIHRGRKNLLDTSKHSITSIVTALENDAELWSVKHWGVSVYALTPLIAAETTSLIEFKVIKEIFGMLVPNMLPNDPFKAVEDYFVSMKNNSRLKDHVSDDHVKQLFNIFADQVKDNKNTYLSGRLDELKQSAQNACIINPKHSMTVKCQMVVKTLVDQIGYAVIPLFGCMVTPLFTRYGISDQTESPYMHPNHPCLEVVFPEAICPIEANASSCSALLTYN